MDDLHVMSYAAGFQHPKPPEREIHTTSHINIPIPIPQVSIPVFSAPPPAAPEPEKMAWGEYVKVNAVNLQSQGDIDAGYGAMSIDGVMNQKVSGRGTNDSFLVNF